MNKVILIGRLGADPEVRYTPDGTAVANFSLATSEKWTDKNTGEKVEKTEWHRIVVWRKLAEICGEYLTKGKRISVEGKIQTRSWESDNGKRYTTEIIMQNMEMLDSAPGGTGGGTSRNRPPQQDEPPQENFGYNNSNSDDDIPF